MWVFRESNIFLAVVVIAVAEEDQVTAMVVEVQVIAVVVEVRAIAVVVVLQVTVAAVKSFLSTATPDLYHTFISSTYRYTLNDIRYLVQISLERNHKVTETEEEGEDTTLLPQASISTMACQCLVRV